MKRPLALVLALAGAVLVAGTAGAQSIRITSVTPASGLFPMNPPGVAITFDYNLGGTADAQVSAFVNSPDPLGPGQTGFAGSFSPVWLTASAGGSGHASISINGHCQDTTLPSGSVNEVRVVLSKSGHFSGPIGPELAKDARAVKFTYTCPVARPDITSKKGITVGGDVGGAGGKFSAWDGRLNLSPADTHLPVGNGKCAFNVSYDMTNVGTAATSPAFRNHLLEDAVVVSEMSGLSLNAGETKQVNTQAYLTPGAHVLTLRLDDGGAALAHEVLESNERNNVFSVKFTLDATCKPKAPVVGTVKLPGLIVAPTPTIAAPR